MSDRSDPSATKPRLPESPWLAQFRRRLRAWFAQHARDLPWRRNRDPYAIWVSEIMLQQTQVATVRPYFERFLKSFPTIQALAQADEEEVLRHWEGLGYYRRARQLHAAAQRMVAEHGGQFPRDPEAVRALPGIGRYTAGAILSIAFDARQPILEANTLRLFSRLLAFRGEPTSATGGRLLWAMAEHLLPRQQVGAFNQALMELGSEICTPRGPACSECPVATLCPTNTAGLQGEIPVPKRRPVFEQRHEIAVVLRRRGQILLGRCPEGERWAGLWDFPRFEVQAEAPLALEAEIRDKLRRRTGVVAEVGTRLTTFKHGVTRFRITLDCYQARYRSGPGAERELAELRWMALDALEQYPLCTTGRKLAHWLHAAERRVQ